MNVKQVEIGKRKFNVAQAAAVDQKRLLSLIGAKIALNSAASGVEKIDQQMLFGALLSMPESSFDEIASIVLYKTVENGKDTIIEVGDFQNEATTYYRLVAAAVVVNLEDFFTYLDSVNAETRKARQGVKVQ